VLKQWVGRLQNKMRGLSKLEEALLEWEHGRGCLQDLLGSLDIQKVSSVREAEAICRILANNELKETRTLETPGWFSTLDRLITLVMNPGNAEVALVFKETGLPAIRTILEADLQDDQVPEEDVLLCVRVLAAYGEETDVPRVCEVAHRGVHAENWFWSKVFEFAADHVKAGRSSWERLFLLLGARLPDQFIAVAFLDAANSLALEGKLTPHPFDSEEGCERLKGWLNETNPDFHSYSRSAAVALSFIQGPFRSSLMELALSHVAVDVQLEAAWALARIREQAGVDQLVGWTKNVHYSTRACSYLEELGLGEHIPAETQESDFKAMAEMSDWLAHPNELGRHPDQLELVKKWHLHWPPTKDKRELWLFHYQVSGESGPETGHGLVGSVTWSFFDSNDGHTPIQVLASHCAWEMECAQDDSKRSVIGLDKALALLRQTNPGVFE